MKHLNPLGQPTEYSNQYNPDLLFPIARKENRESLSLTILPFVGRDTWTSYEISWLNKDGLPQVRIGEFVIDCASPFIIESKSFKLYLNSFNQTRFESEQAVINRLVRDLSLASGADVGVALSVPGNLSLSDDLPGSCIDNCSLIIEHYHPQPTLLGVDSESNSQYRLVYSELLKTNCPVTNQPDWATVWVEYVGYEIVPESLLAYIVSFREHQDFHEHCVERLFCEIKQYCEPEQLSVYARYTRRGGLDINPLRSDFPAGTSQLTQRLRTVRQ